jgi:preprotein translocase subunit SecG
MPNQAKWALSLLLGLGLIWVGWRVSFVLVTLHVLVCFVLILVIMLQSGSAADLAGAFGGAGSQTAFGPRGAATLLSKATTWCAIVFMLTSLALWLKRGPGQGDTSGGASSVLEQTLKTAPAPEAPPPATMPMPTTPPAGNSAPVQNPAPAPAPKK